MRVIQIEGIGEVQVVKHASARNMRITIGHHDKVRVTIPKYAPYSVGTAFAMTKKAWIMDNRQPDTKLKHGFAVGKFHHLYFQASPDVSTVSTRQKTSEIWVTYPTSLGRDDPEVQTAARKAAIRALRRQAENLLPKRLADLAAKHDFSYTSVEVRHLKARWGSCSSKQEITLNLFLMQLPWELIDYVLLHELVHTKALHHGPDFWQIFEAVLPGAKQKRKNLKEYKPSFA